MTPKEAIEKSHIEEWSAADWLVALVVLIIGAIVVGFLQAIAES